MTGRGERPCQTGKDPVGPTRCDVAGTIDTFGFDPRLDPETIDATTALGGEQGESVGHGTFPTIRGPVLDPYPLRTGGSRHHGGRAAAVEVERGVRTGLDHHLAQLVETDALGEGRLPAVDAEQVHP